MTENRVRRDIDVKIELIPQKEKGLSPREKMMGILMCCQEVDKEDMGLKGDRHFQQGV